jgi:pimeloyl-ACP methyl ester carboxylesterase
MRFIKGLCFSLIAIVVIGAVALYFANQKYLPLTDDFIRAGGSVTELTDGKISYQWHGPANGEVIILAHGFSAPKFVWQNTIPDLTSAGYRVLSYDHFGRGHSSRPRVDYDRDFYVRELRELLDSQSITEPVNLIGYSMGGANVISFSAAHPERVKQLVLLAPAGFVPEYSGLSKLLTIAAIGESVLTLAGPSKLIKDLERIQEKGIVSANTISNYKTQFYLQGSTFALTSTLQNYPMYNLRNDYTKVGNTSIPVTAIWGDKDHVAPYSSAQIMLQTTPQMILKTIPNADHYHTIDRASEVNAFILEALRTES